MEVIPARMHRSNRNFNISPWANPGHLTIFCARGVGNLTFAWVGWGKLNRKYQLSSDCAEVANSYKHVFGRDGRV